MVLDITTHFIPYSLNLSRREPVEFFLEIKNKAAEPTAATIQLHTGYRLALDTGGIKNREEIRIDELKPNERKNWYFKIFPKVNTEIGENPVDLLIFEHFQNDFSLIKKKYILNLSLLGRK